ncbi:Rhodopsin, GQ-coupled [Holothuria leucospilota]|uniref:Rhodopsin, GQ-coupled n=1 Tax=Holothuria leucospilota TaxID=206669 RepID=A0A9Q0YN60_HOLLE|nr:Rhodopsin, GQ-coupled [Holothuria leucospilota]
MAFSNSSLVASIQPTDLLTTDQSHIQDGHTERLIRAITIGVISLIGIPGNGLIIFAVFISRRLRTSTNIFVANLAFSDLVTCLVIPFNSIALLHDTWPFPESVCKLVGALTFIMIAASIINFALIAFNRYYLITRPRKLYDQLYSQRKIALMILFSWLYVILVVYVPPACGIGKIGYSQRYHVCTTETEHSEAIYYNIIRGVLIQLFFVTFVLVCYALIFRYVRNITKTSLSSFNKTDQMQRQLQKRQIKVTKNLFYTVCFYMFCFLPYGIACVIPNGHVAVPSTSLIGLLSSCVNPFIYGLSHPQFKDVVKSILSCKFRHIEGTSSFLRKGDVLEWE